MFLFLFILVTGVLDEMEPPSFSRMDPCVSCGKIYVDPNNVMGRVQCLNETEHTCRAGHMWCQKCWMDKYAEDWKSYCPAEIKKKQYRERRF